MRNIKAHISIILFSVLSLGSASCSSAKSTEQSENVSRAESDAQTSKMNLQTTPDLAFFNLKGNVKSVTYNCDASFPLFTEHTSAIEFDKNEKCEKLVDYLYLPEVASTIKTTLNEKGEIVKAIYPNKYPSQDSPGDYEFVWNNGQLHKITYEAWEFKEEYFLTYKDGIISTMSYNEHTDGGNAQTIYNFSDFKFDNFGNWTKCTCESSSITWDNYSDEEEIEKNTEPSQKMTIERTITYY